jgi:hypothetical protein
MATAENEASFGLQLVKATRKHEAPARHVHKHSRALGTPNIGILRHKLERPPWGDAPGTARVSRVAGPRDAETFLIVFSSRSDGRSGR